MAVLGGGANYHDSKIGAVFFSHSCSMILQLAFHLTQNPDLFCNDFCLHQCTRALNHTSSALLINP